MIINRIVPCSLVLLLALVAGSCRLESVQVQAFQVLSPLRTSTIRQSTTCSPSQQKQQQQRQQPLCMARGGGGGPSRRPRRPLQAPVVDPNRPVMNQEITATVLRVITPNPKGKDEPLGIMSRDEALSLASEMGDLDLILVNNQSDPPVCKIVDYSKHRYMLEKKAKEVKKNSKASELKEIKMSYKIDVHDYAVRKNSCAKFLKQGNRVKCTVMFRGREVQHDKLGFDLLAKLALELDDICVREQGRPVREGRNLSWILTPRPELLKLVNEQRRALDKARKQKKILALQQGLAAEDDKDDEDDDDDDDDEEDYDEDDDDDDGDESMSKFAATTPATKVKAEKTLEELLGTDEYL